MTAQIRRARRVPASCRAPFSCPAARRSARSPYISGLPRALRPSAKRFGRRGWHLRRRNGSPSAHGSATRPSHPAGCGRCPRHIRGAFSGKRGHSGRRRAANGSATGARAGGKGDPRVCRTRRAYIRSYGAAAQGRSRAYSPTAGHWWPSERGRRPQRSGRASPAARGAARAPGSSAAQPSAVRPEQVWAWPHSRPDAPWRAEIPHVPQTPSGRPRRSARRRCSSRVSRAPRGRPPSPVRKSAKGTPSHIGRNGCSSHHPHGSYPYLPKF